MTVYDVRLATEQDVEHILDNLRPADIAEGEALWGKDFRRHWANSWMESGRKSQVGTVDGEPVFVFWARRSYILWPKSVPAAFGTPKVDRHAAEFMRRSKPLLAELLKEHTFMENFVHADNTRAIRWLKWLGFSVYPAQEYGRNKALFHKFNIGEDPDV